MNNKCVCCGALIPEGVQYCSNCYVEGEKKMETKFELGKIVMTNGIARYLSEETEEIIRMGFFVECTNEQLQGLGKYLRQHGIKYGRIKS